ncbi:MAG: RNA polymerase sigma factor [Bacteroidota bacterium]
MLSSNKRMEPRDQPNIAAILAGDTKAFSVLVDSYKNMVFTVALRMLEHREEAEEVAQDTFIKVFRSLSKFKGDAKLSTWIYRIAYNTCLDRLKKNKREEKNVAIEDIGTLNLKQMNDAVDLLERSERSLLIQKCMQQLSPKDAALLTLFYFEEKNLKELAVVLKMSESSVKVGLFRARSRLAKLLKQYMEPEML